jgi:hypothetical protein
MRGTQMSKKEFKAQCLELELAGWWLMEYAPELKYAKYAKNHTIKIVGG